jgi:hypothetical protein
MYTPYQRRIAVLYGVVGHLVFASAIGVMMWKLYSGLQGGPTLSLPLALGWNLILVLQFPLFHSPPLALPKSKIL